MATLLKDTKKRDYCHDCGVHIGSKHVDGCDNESCIDCGLQRISCGCNSERRERFTGISHERIMMICELNNWYTKWESGRGWIPADKDDKNSHHDLNRGAQALLKLKNESNK